MGEMTDSRAGAQDEMRKHKMSLKHLTVLQSKTVFIDDENKPTGHRSQLWEAK